ncbi:FIST C-terminal domain-containing protein [Rhodospirillales bacterium]|nr:FIST C-terminal domain-containing protein [Rhodospirillales bacterium]
MSVFPYAFSSATDWARAADEISDGLMETGPAMGSIGLLYVTDQFADNFKSIAALLRQRTGLDTWVGTLGLGVIGGADAVFDRPGAAAMILDIPSDACRIIERTPIPNRWSDELMQWVETVRPTSALVHADPSTPNVADHIETLAKRTSAFLIGGLTCSRTAQHQLTGDLGSGGVSGLMFSPDVALTVGLSQGCSPLGSSHEITGGEGNVVAKIDGRSALEVFKEDIGEMLARDLQRVAGYFHVAFPVSGSDDSADYMVRNLIAIDQEHGWLGVGTEVSQGDRIMFVRRDPASARADLDRMLKDVKKRLPGAARGAVYISCVARGPEMFGTETAEAKHVSDGLDGAPVIGFYAGGEISHDRLYGYTGVLLVFG